MSESEIRTMLQTALQALGETQRASLTPQRCKVLAANPKDFRNLTTLICIDLLFATGIRVMELAAIGLSDIDLTEHSIRVHGKGDRERLVFLPGKPLITLLEAYIDARKSMAPESDQLILTAQGTVADTQYIRLLIRGLGEKGQLTRRITPHMLRHSAATHLLNNGVDIRFVQRLLGHQSITTTQIYTQVADSTLKRVICEGHPINKIFEE